MARIKLNLPDCFSFSTEIKVRITDLNYGGHLANNAILEFMHEVRMQFLNEMGFKNELDSIEGNGLIQSDAAIVYKAETFYGDTLFAEIVATDFSKHGFDFLYRFTSKSQQKEVARAKAGMVYFDYEKRNIAVIPEKIKNVFLQTPGS